jgi:hypothetical protein
VGSSFLSGRRLRDAPPTPARLLVLAACGVLLVVTVSARAAPTVGPRWLPPLDVSTPGTDALVPVVAVDPRGDAMAVWAQSMNKHWTVLAAKRTASRPWSPPRAISSDTNDAASPQVATDAAGNAVAVWQWFDGQNSIIQSAAYDIRKARWSGPTNLSLSGRDSVAPRLAVDDKGDAVAVWTTLSFAGWTVEAATRSAGGAWEKASDIITPVAGTASPTVAIDASGDVVVVWAATTGTAWVVQASYRPSGGSWSAPADLSEPDRTESITPQVAIDQDGQAEVVWSGSSGGNPVIEQSARSAGGAWATARVISPAGVASVAPLISIGPSGDAAVVWTSSGKFGLVVTAAYRRKGGDWGPAVSVSGASSGPLSPSVAVDGHGNVVVAWTRATAGRSLVQAASRTAASGTWTKPTSLSRAGADALTPNVALGPSGDGVLVWSRFSALGFVVQAVGYDRSGPDLTRVVVPGKGVVGGRLGFAVTARDIWSGIASVRWSFGDGTVAQGKSAFHSYSRAGRFTVRVTATDASGHSTTARRFVSIAGG